MRLEVCGRLDPRIQRVALRNLAMLDAAELLEDLTVCSGNRLEAMKGGRDTGTVSGMVAAIQRACSRGGPPRAR